MKKLHYSLFMLLLVWSLHGVTERLSVASDGSQGSLKSENFQIMGLMSEDGRFVVFSSDADNLVPDDTNGVTDVFMRDRLTGTTSRISVSSVGQQANAWSGHACISADGMVIAFCSAADNLVAGDINGRFDVFVHHRVSGQTERVSLSSSGNEGNDGSYDPSLSHDGRYVAFLSLASNLVDDDLNGEVDAFWHDCQTGITQRASVADDGSEGNQFTSNGMISYDGNLVVFRSLSDNLVPGDSNTAWDVFVRDIGAGQTYRVSVASDGTQHTDTLNNNGCLMGTISKDNRYAVFSIKPDGLVAGDVNGYGDVYLHDRSTGQTSLVSVATDGSQGNGESKVLNISYDGRFILFSSKATNFSAQDGNPDSDLYVRDRIQGTTELVSLSHGTSAGGEAQLVKANMGASWGHVDSAGEVAFFSDSDNLIADDSNGVSDLFINDRLALVETEPVSGIDIEWAESGGEVLLDFGHAVSARGVVWAVHNAPTLADHFSTDGSGTGGFSSHVSGLVQTTTYFLRAYATNDFGVAYGPLVRFTTLDGRPDVLTRPVAEVSSSAALLRGEIVSEGGMNLTGRGLCWSSSPNPTIMDSHQYVSGILGRYEHRLEGLSPSQTWYVRAFAENSYGLAYGDTVSFTTRNGGPIVRSLAVTDVECHGAWASGEIVDAGSAEVIRRGFCLSLSALPTLADRVVTIKASARLFEGEIANLSPGRQYFLRAYATNRYGTAYGEDIVFTTPAETTEYTVRFNVMTGGSLNGPTLQTVPRGGSCLGVKAEPGEGFFFLEWQESVNGQRRADNPLLVSNVVSDMNWTARLGGILLKLDTLVDRAWVLKRAFPRVICSLSGYNGERPLLCQLWRVREGDSQALLLREENGASLAGREWVYIDDQALLGHRYRYWLRVVDSSGNILGSSAAAELLLQ